MGCTKGLLVAVAMAISGMAYAEPRFDSYWSGGQFFIDGVNQDESGYACKYSYTVAHVVAGAVKQDDFSGSLIVKPNSSGNLHKNTGVWLRPRNVRGPTFSCTRTGPPSTAKNPQEAQHYVGANGGRLIVDNNCDGRVSLLLRYRDEYGTLITKGWFDFNPGQQYRLGTPMGQLTDFLVAVKRADGSFDAGTESAVYNGVTYKFKRAGALTKETEQGRLFPICGG